MTIDLLRAVAADHNNRWEGKTREKAKELLFHHDSNLDKLHQELLHTGLKATHMRDCDCSPNQRLMALHVLSQTKQLKSGLWPEGINLAIDSVSRETNPAVRRAIGCLIGSKGIMQDWHRVVELKYTQSAFHEVEAGITDALSRSKALA